MAVLLHSSPLPGFLAPRVSFDVVIEAYAEQLFEQQVQVYLGQSWWWYRPRNWLIHAPEWGQPEEKSTMRSTWRREQEKEERWTVLDDWLFKFATTRLS